MIRIHFLTVKWQQINKHWRLTVVSLLLRKCMLTLYSKAGLDILLSYQFGRMSNEEIERHSFHFRFYFQSSNQHCTNSVNTSHLV